MNSHFNRTITDMPIGMIYTQTDPDDPRSHDVCGSPEVGLKV